MVDEEAHATGGSSPSAPRASRRSAPSTTSSATDSRCWCAARWSLTGDRLTDAQPSFDHRTNGRRCTCGSTRPAAARMRQEVTRENVKQAHGDHADREGQGRGDHASPVIQERDSAAACRSPGRHDHHRGEQPRAAAARRLARRADGDHRGAHRRPEPRARQHREGLQRHELGLPRDRGVHVALLHAVRADLVARAGGEPAVAGGAALAPAGDAHPARHRRHRAHARHGDRRQRADQRAHPRGAARRRHAAGRDPRGLRARLGDDSRLERDHLHRRHVAADGAGRGARLRRGALPRHPDLDVLGGGGVARHRQPGLRPPPARRRGSPSATRAWK